MASTHSKTNGPKKPLKKTRVRKIIYNIKKLGKISISRQKLLKKTRVRKIIYNIYKQERIPMEGEAKIKFTEKETYNLMKVLGVSGGREFIEIFKKNLIEEVGWARYYIRAEIDPASVLAKW